MLIAYSGASTVDQKMLAKLGKIVLPLTVSEVGITNKKIRS